MPIPNERAAGPLGHAARWLAALDATPALPIPRSFTVGIPLTLDDVDAPKVHKEEVRPLPHEQARELLETARRDRLEALYVVAVQSGLRQGELLALRWEDVDLEAWTLQVRRTLTSNGGKLAVGPTKTAKGRRTVQAHPGRHRDATGPSETAVGRDGQGRR